MSIFKCKMCGGTLEINNNETVAECQYCGTQQTLPKLDDERKANLYDRANHFRRNNEYDKAMGIYEQILNEDSTDAEAYWSLVLCNYGIEYVEDPSTRKRVPTVNRAQFTSVFADENYKSALEYADTLQRSIYEAEAKAIDDIQKGILAISSQEKPFDVFICYKETDNDGRRTVDSVLANDLYHQLVREGFKVFFSRITLEDKLGTAYEPYIFAALNSAKVMVVLGTKPEYFNAVWVKNEWSRYLALVKNSNGQKMLIPAYKDMDPYDLPEEFSHLQAQDMSKLGFMQDLIRGIKKILAKDEPKTAVVKETVVQTASTVNANISPLLERAFMFLEDGDFVSADEYCEKVLDIDPKCAKAYVGKLMAELKVKKQDDLATYPEEYAENSNYEKAVRFADEKLKATLEDYAKNVIYLKAKRAKEEANSEEGYKYVSAIFARISGYKDADEQKQKCLELAQEARNNAIYISAKTEMDKSNKESYKKAISIFETISGWRDTDEQIETCKKKLLAIEKKARIAKEKAKANLKKISIIICSIIALLIVFLILLNSLIVPIYIYSKATELLSAKDYDSAIILFSQTKGYKDSEVKIDECGIAIYGEKKWKTIKKIESAKVGDRVIFGAYEQDNDTSNGKEDIEWIVLAKKKNKLLVISDKALNCKPYNSSGRDITWEECSLRAWMNDTFLKTAFNAYEQLKIKSTKVSADKNPYWDTNPGNGTTDKVFLLSINEVNKYFSSDEARKCVATAYAIENGAYTCSDYTKDGVATCECWLRSPGHKQDNAACIYFDGLVDSDGRYVSYYHNSVRPAMWIDLDA